MGYVGIGYSGNTVNAALPRGQTIDDVLEDALFDAGCVLLSNYRSRALSRLKWSRSKRMWYSTLLFVLRLQRESSYMNLISLMLFF